MRSLYVLREMQRRQARRALGVPPFGGRLVLPQAKTADLAPDILALPENVEDLGPMQEADGTFHFALDFSSLDGPDVLG